MHFVWTEPAIEDVERVHRFLAKVDPVAAAAAVQTLVAAPVNLITWPRSGAALTDYEPREVRHLILGHYELRHEIQGCTILILRVWHTREQR